MPDLSNPFFVKAADALARQHYPDFFNAASGLLKTAPALERPLRELARQQGVIFALRRPEDIGEDAFMPTNEKSPLGIVAFVPRPFSKGIAALQTGPVEIWFGAMRTGFDFYLRHSQDAPFRRSIPALMREIARQELGNPVLRVKADAFAKAEAGYGKLPLRDVAALTSPPPAAARRASVG